MAIGVAMMVAGTVAKQVGAGQQGKARNKVMRAEQDRQAAFQRENEATSQQSRDRYKDFQGQQGQKATELADFFGQTRAAPANSNAPAEMPASSSNVVVLEQEKQKRIADAYSGQQDAALGNLRAFGDLLGGISLKQARDAGQVGTVNSFARGSQAILPLELEAANNKGGGMRLFGDLLGQGGSALTSFGMMGRGGITPTVGTPPYAGGTGTNPVTGMRFGGV